LLLRVPLAHATGTSGVTSWKEQGVVGASFMEG
jgi:hypothetical protein